MCLLYAIHFTIHLYGNTSIDIQMHSHCALPISPRQPEPVRSQPALHQQTIAPDRYTASTAPAAERLLQEPPQLTLLERQGIPIETRRVGNFPNPFNPETWIPYRLAEDAFVTLTIYDAGGQVVRMIEVGHQIASAYENRSKAIYWDGRNESGESVASGVYFYHLAAGHYSATRRMVILK